MGSVDDEWRTWRVSRGLVEDYWICGGFVGNWWGISGELAIYGGLPD